MNPIQQTCDAERLEAYLHGRLGEQQEHEVESHIESCESCRYRMEQYAAEPASWEEATELLGDPRWRNEEYQSSLTNRRSNDSQNNHRLTQSVIESLAPTDDPTMLGRIDGYEISGVIGCGGMGAVLKGFDRSLSRVVAIKVMAPHLASSGGARVRFAREAKAAAAMTHDNVIDIYGVSEANGLPYLVMPYARGPSLQKRIDDRGPLPVVEVLRIGSQIAAGLAAAHAQGLVHRDIKPANILLNDGVERLVITDFGLARAVDDASVTRTGVIAGTPQYMSPEQARGETVDCRSDLFSLGSVMYTLCVGHPPFRAESAYGILRRITDNDPRPIRETNPDIPEWLCRIVEELMAKRPDERFDSAEEVAELLEGCLAHVQQPATTPLPARISKPQLKAGAQPPSRFRRVAPGILGGFLCVLAGIVIVLELNKGTLTIESAEPGIPIRIMQGNDVREEMTVTAGNSSVRIAAGQYVVEIVGQHDGLRVANDGVVTVTRGEKQLVKITRHDGGSETGIQGQWKVIEMTWNGKPLPPALVEAAAYLIGSKTFAPIVDASVRANNSLMYKLNDATNPKQIDLTEMESGETHRGIYELDGDRLRIYYSKDERPESFEAAAIDGPPRSLLVLERVYGGAVKPDVATSAAQQQSLAARRLVAQLRNVQVRRAKLLQTQGDRHPELLKLDSEIKAIERLIARADSEVTMTTGSVTVEVPNDTPEVIILRGRKDEVEIVEKAIRTSDKVAGIVDSAKYHVEIRQGDKRVSETVDQSVREAVERFLFAMLSDKADDIAGWSENAREFKKGLASDRLEVASIHVSKAGNRALVVTSEARLSEPEPDGRTSGCLVIKLEKENNNWTIKDIDFETQTSAQEEVLRFLSEERVPGAVDSPQTEKGPTTGAADTGRQLLDAVTEFNQQQQQNPIGKDQLPLTDDEVVASIRWAVMRDGQNEISNPYRQQLRHMVEQRQLPSQWVFKVVTEVEGTDGERFRVWSVRLVYTGTPGVPPYNHAIRDQLLWQLDAEGQPIELGTPESGDDDADSKPLAAAIRGFNRAHRQLAGLDMPPLTEQEVIAAIRYQKLRRNEFDVTDGEFARMQQIADNRRLPTDAEISVLTGFQPGDGYRYDIWSVGFSMRKQVNTVPYPFTGFTIREHYVRSQSLELDKIAWGPVAENGLQAGVRFEPRQAQYSIGQKVTPYFYYRNTGDRKFDISFPNMESGKLVAVDNAGAAIPFDTDKNPKWIVGFMGFGEFGFGSQHEIRGRPIILGDVERGDAEFAVRAQAGQTVRVRFLLSNYADRGGSQLQTGEIAFSMAPAVEVEQVIGREIQLQSSEAESVQAVLANIYADQIRDDNLSITVGTSPKSIIVRGPAKLVTEVAKLIARLDFSTKPAVRVEPIDGEKHQRPTVPAPLGAIWPSFVPSINT